jgi:hypothetical protein
MQDKDIKNNFIAESLERFKFDFMELLVPTKYKLTYHLKQDLVYKFIFINIISSYKFLT